ncbi:MAG TPA: aminotransferase class III-fold pyridoxal phosphate-dependent enzyme, partial [Actinomycetota bacterium]|nr:aminotransferase class III-fold pyridoxal phosphate-dependent enzyme [Actinomycetota bacterium]
REACDAAGALLVLDEVQTGAGRCGAWFAHQLDGVRPDVVTLAKGLAGGLPIGVCIATEEAAAAFGPGDHASTFGGGPIPCAAALAVLDVIVEEGLLGRARSTGERLMTSLAEAARVAIEVRGRGLLVGVELPPEMGSRDVVLAALRRGLVLTQAGRNTVRFTPALTVTEADVDAAVQAFEAVLGEET